MLSQDWLVTRRLLNLLPVHAILAFTLTPACVGYLISTKFSIKCLKRLASCIAVGRICQLDRKAPTSTVSSTREWTTVQWSDRISLMALLTVFVCSKSDLSVSPLVFAVANALVILTNFVASWVCPRLPFVTRIKQLGFFVFKCINGIAPTNSSSRFRLIMSLGNHLQTLLAQRGVQVDFPRTNALKSTLTYRGQQLWKSLPSSVRLLSHDMIQLFKLRLQDFLKAVY